MKKILPLLFLIVSTTCSRHDPVVLSGYLTTPDRSYLFQSVAFPQLAADSTLTDHIVIDTLQRYQTMDGFGFCLTGGSAMLLKTKLNDAQRTQLLRELFLRDSTGIGVSYLRISLGASDLDEKVFSYDDLPAGQTDVALEKFSLAYDTLYLLPVLKEIIKLQPSIRIMASPWSAPAWMKDNQKVKAGKLLPRYYDTYARYFVRYLQAMAQEGITIDAVTLQNEPENPHNTPSMLMTAEEQIDFVKNHLGPAFRAQNINTKIIVFDHNADHPDYPITILNDSLAQTFIDGSAFHLYLGEVSALSRVHEAHPDKNIYFTEQWTSGKGEFGGDLQWHIKQLIIGASRNWSKTVLEWNLANDPQFQPHTDDGGCTLCQGALTIGDGVTRNVSYYIIAHASKLVPPGSVRIASTEVQGFPNVAFLTPQHQRVLIVLNESNADRTFKISTGGEPQNATLPAGAVATFIW